MSAWPPPIASHPQGPLVRRGKWLPYWSLDWHQGWLRVAPIDVGARRFVKVYAFWAAPDGVVHMALLSNRHGGQPHEIPGVGGRVFCGRSPHLPRCAFRYDLRATCPTCIRTFEYSMERYSRYWDNVKSTPPHVPCGELA